MTTSARQQQLEEEMRQDFADSVTAEEIDYETVPAELMEAFGESIFATPSDMISDEDMWGAEAKKQDFKR